MCFGASHAWRVPAYSGEEDRGGAMGGRIKWCHVDKEGSIGAWICLLVLWMLTEADVPQGQEHLRRTCGARDLPLGSDQ